MQMSKTTTWVFANNLKKILDHKGWSMAQAAREWKIPPMTFHNTIKNERSPSLSTVEHIAKSAGYEVWQLLMPEFNPGNPPVIRDIGKDESAFYAKLSELVKQEFSK